LLYFIKNNYNKQSDITITAQTTFKVVSSKFILGLLIFILGVHVLASVFHWYWTFPWFDMPMHFLGGLWLAMVYFWLKVRTNANRTQNNADGKHGSILLTVIGCLSFVALIGVLWEFFEFFCDVFIAAKGYVEVAQRSSGDTMADLFFDLLGGLVFLIIYKFYIYRKSNPK